MINPPEKSEQVRITLAEIITIIIENTLFDCMRPYITNMVNLCKALCMDPYGEVVIKGCRAMSILGQTGGD